MYLDYETTAEDFIERFQCDEEFKRAMCKPVAPNGKCHFDSGQTLKMITLAWFEDPHPLVMASIWDEASKSKMRQPVLTNGYLRLDDQTIRNLILFSSSY